MKAIQRDNFYLSVLSTNNKSWVRLINFNGKRKKYHITISRYHKELKRIIAIEIIALKFSRHQNK